MFAAINQNHALGLLVGALSSIFWTLAYALIIRQGFRDRTFGMPLAALGANLARESIFLFETLKHGVYDARLAMLLPWTMLDGAIIYQCFRYGKEDFCRHCAAGSRVSSARQKAVLDGEIGQLSYF